MTFLFVLTKFEVMYTNRLYTSSKCYLSGLTKEIKLQHSQQVNTLPTEAIIGEKNRLRCIARLQEVKQFPLHDTSHAQKKAAVLIPLCMVNQELSLLYTLRSADLKSFRGQVSFPGGMHDEEDGNLEETALRETYEELGIPKSQIDIWGHAVAVGTVSKDMYVLPYVGYIGEINLNNLKLNPQEVESTFTIPLIVLCNPSYFRYTQFRNGLVLPVFLGGKHRVWGMTATITHIFLRALIPESYKHKLKRIKTVKGTGK